MAIGELFLSAFLQVLFDRLASHELLEFLRQEGLHSKLKKWEQTLNMVQSVLGDAEEKQLTDRAVKMWLDNLRDLAYDVEDILDEFATEALSRKLKMQQRDQASTSTGKVRKLIPARLSNLSPSAVKFSSHMRSQIKDMSGRLEVLCKQRIDLGLQVNAGGVSTARQQRRSPTSSVQPEPAVYGRDQDKAKVLEMVQRDGPDADANFRVISIVAMGGVGKTTLAREVYNDKATEDFNPRVWVRDCPSLVSFPEGGLPKTNLELLCISGCEKLKDTINSLQSLSIPQEAFSTNLTQLSIGGLHINKPPVEWGLHNLTSLTSLEILGCPEVESFPQEEIGMMLPPSLQYLWIVSFPKLKYLFPNGFQILTSLENLFIINCPNLTSFPEVGLPSSLLQLDIRNCPLLKKQCKRDKGREWSKIAHIPCVRIDRKFIYDPEEEE